MADDPYAPRSSASYASAAVHADEAASSSSSSASSSAWDDGSSSRSSSSTYPSTGDSYSSQASSSGNAKPASLDDEAEPGQDEPLFGGTPFRNAQSRWAPGSGFAEEGDEVGFSSKDEFYTLLNVDKSATEEQIKEAYKALAIVLHPDKHTDPEKKASAEKHFRSVQRAYEVLSNAETRGVYDHFGEAGLKSNWAVSMRGRTPADLQAEFEKEILARRTREAEDLIRSKGNFSATVDATALFAAKERIPRPPHRQGQPVTFVDRWNRVGATQLMGRHSFETQLTQRNAVNLSGQMFTRGGMGGGNMLGTVKTQWSTRFNSEVSLALIRPRMLTAKGTYAIDANTFVTCATGMHSPAVPPSLNLTWGQRISSKSTLTGFTTFRSGTYQLGSWGDPSKLNPMQLMRREPAAVSVGLTSQAGEGKGWTVQTAVSGADQSISVDWGTKVLGGVKVRLGLNLGTGTGLSVNANGERRITETVRFGMGVVGAFPGGVSLRLKVNRLGQKVILPIMLSPEFRSDLLLAFTLVPAATMTVLHHYYLVPKKKLRIESRLQKLRRENQDMIRERREEALSARELLREQGRKRWMTESRKGGLVIVEAWYGKLSAFQPPRPHRDLEELERLVWESGSETLAQDTANGDTAPQMQETDVETQWWDVRIPLQAMVNKGQLIIPGGRTKSNLLGFNDPCMGEKKHLKVRYIFRNKLHEAIVDDVNPFAAPLRAHQIA